VQSPDRHDQTPVFGHHAIRAAQPAPVAVNTDVDSSRLAAHQSDGEWPVPLQDRSNGRPNSEIAFGSGGSRDSRERSIRNLVAPGVSMGSVTRLARPVPLTPRSKPLNMRHRILIPIRMLASRRRSGRATWSVRVISDEKIGMIYNRNSCQVPRRTRNCEFSE
jgi:hypothetical protein